jgi:c-di-GMP-binding flagellar brake protein YcgR
MAEDEKRKYRRLNLKIEDGYFGNFRLSSDETFVAPIVNLSAGGLNMAASAKDREKIKEGDHLLLQKIVGGASLSFLSQIKAEVRWIKKLTLPGYISVGCRFEEIADDVRQQLIKFVDSDRMTRGQYE